MTDEEAMVTLRVAAKKRASCEITDAEAVKELDSLIDQPGLTNKQIIALGIAAGELKRPAQRKWVSPKKQLPEADMPILMAVRDFRMDSCNYYTGRYITDGIWALKCDPNDDFYCKLYFPPTWWCYIDKPEAPE